MKTALFITIVIVTCCLLVSCGNKQKYYDWAIKGNSQELKKALENKLNPNIQDEFGVTLLFCASEYGHRDLVKLLLDKGANINLATNTGTTPLMGAAISGRIEIVKYLIKNGAKLGSRDRFGKTALMYGVRPKNSVNVLTVLLENGVDINSVDNFGKSALFWAVQDNNESAIKFLISKGINVNIINKDGENALIFYLSGGKINKEIVGLFINAGTNLNVKSQGKTALDIALASGNKEIIALIRNAQEKQK